MSLGVSQVINILYVLEFLARDTNIIQFEGNDLDRYNIAN